MVFTDKSNTHVRTKGSGTEESGFVGTENRGYMVGHWKYHHIGVLLTQYICSRSHVFSENTASWS